MRTLKYAAALIVGLSALPAWAQSPMDVIFSEVEKRIIKDYYGVDPNQRTQQTNRSPDWAVHDSNEQDYGRNNNDYGRDNGDDNEDEGRDDKGKKGKKDKNKNKKNKHESKGKSNDMPYGLAKRSQLPPGLQKQYDKNGRLPRGLNKRNLPNDLKAKLLKRPSEQEVTIVGNDVVLLDRVTGVVLDVILDAVRNGGKPKSPAPAPTTNGSLSAPPSQTPTQTQQPSVIDSIFNTIFGKGN